jgi:exo-beta-1,3-glucanase (GH17 family)
LESKNQFGNDMKATVFLLLGLVALACADLQTFMSAMTPSATHPGCVRFSPYVNGLSPNGATAPDAVLIGKLLDVLVQKTKFRCIMIGDMSGIYSKVVEAASTRGIKVFGVIYISSDFKTNGDINEAIRLSKLYTSTVIGLSCGLEVAYENKDLVGSATVVNRCIKQLRDGGVKQPIGYCETFYSWCGNNDWPCSNVYSQVYENVDFVGLSQFAWWENIMSKNFPCVKARDALDFTITKITELKRELGDSKPILLTSHGW